MLAKKQQQLIMNFLSFHSTIEKNCVEEKKGQIKKKLAWHGLAQQAFFSAAAADYVFAC